MNDLNSEIDTAFQATSLILVFVTVLFGLRYPQIVRDIRADVPQGEKDKIDFWAELKLRLIVNCGPLCVINGAVSYLFAPLFIRVLSRSRFDIWGFDFSRTSFVFVATMVFLSFLWSLVLASRITARLISKE